MEKKLNITLKMNRCRDFFNGLFARYSLSAEEYKPNKIDHQESKKT